jgi:hypothetical protein
MLAWHKSHTHARLAVTLEQLLQLSEDGKYSAQQPSHL